MHSSQFRIIITNYTYLVSPSKPTTESSIADSNHHDNQLVATFSLLTSPSSPIYSLPNSPIMTGRGGGGGGGGGRRVLLPPINMIFKLLQSNATVSVWLYEQLSIRIEGKIRGFDEFMNLVIDDAVEVSQITKTNEEETRRSLGTYAPRSTNAAQAMVRRLTLSNRPDSP
ncbi:hypothetical protein E4U32_007480 [Claviceps aff. humidiphila group G2b]|nr:hypothetical protein E4U32_007480 [Claviceps aff. humidiphila group G2b]